MRDASPLRYPGGKWRLSGCFEKIIACNFSRQPLYIEPYAGGASLALSLLFTGAVAEVFLNDLDPAIHAFWVSVLKHHDELCSLIESVPVTPAEWRRQHIVYRASLASKPVQLGFATFFLNRTNHSGILNGGMIGGKYQKGIWKLDARFNRAELIRRIRRIASFKDRIHLRRQDAVAFLNTQKVSKNTLVYLDPPYYKAGWELYFNAYKPGDHAAVRDRAVNLRCPWIVSYDDVPEIRRLYKSYQARHIRLLHTARSARMGKEVIFFSHRLRLPRPLR
jgi:DNA adenine methylase